MATGLSAATKMTNPIRGLVSKRRIRYTQDGFDLDLTYINDRIIAMGYPADHMEAIYRNKIEDVQRMLEKNHTGCYKIYNLCSERSYDHKRFPYYSVYPFKDHNPPDIELITAFCRDVDEHLRANCKNVVAVHCKAGKGRTGTMICCYLLYSRQFQTADEALHYYAQRRTSDEKGVTIPSQRRYVEYFATLLRSNETYQPVQLYICEIRITGTVNIREGTINVSGETPKPLPEFRRTEDAIPGGGLYPYSMLAKMDYCMPLAGDVKIELVKSLVLRKEKRCHFWFNTYFVERAARKDAEGNLLLKLSKTEIDDAHKDKHHKEYPNNFAIELVLRRVPNGKYSESVSLKKCHPATLAPPSQQQQQQQVVMNSSPLIRSSLENNWRQQQQQQSPLSAYQQQQQHHHQQFQQQQQQDQQYRPQIVGNDPYRAAMIKHQQNNHNNHQQQQTYQQPVHDVDENNHQQQHHLEYSGTSSSESSTEEEGWDSGECPTQLLESPAKAANLLYYRNDNYYYGSCSSSPSSSASHPNPTTTTNTGKDQIYRVKTVSSSNLDQQPLANTTTISSSSGNSRSSVKPAVVVPEPSSLAIIPRASNGKLPVESNPTVVACPSPSTSSTTNANASAWPSIGLRRKKKKSFKSGSARNFTTGSGSGGASSSGKSGRFRTFRWLRNMRGDPNLKKVLATSSDIVTLTSAGVRPAEEPDPVPSTPPPTPTIATLSLNAAELFLPSVSSENLLSLDYYSSICDKQLSFESPCKSPGHLMKLNLSRPAAPPPDCPVIVAKPSEQRLKIGFEVTPSPSPTSSQSQENPFTVVVTEDPELATASALPPKSHNLVPRSENASFCDRILQTFVAGISPRKSSAEHAGADLHVPTTSSSSSNHNSPLVARAVSRCSSFSLRELGQELRSVIKAQPAATKPNPDEPSASSSVPKKTSD